MINAWDRPPFPTEGDPAERFTYEGVGRVTSAWETIEIQMGFLYLFFKNSDYGKQDLDGYRQSAKTAKDRIALINRLAEEFFVTHCDQAIEHQLFKIIRSLEGFVLRRNEVAHGIVRPFIWFKNVSGASDATIKDSFQACLLPSNFQRNWVDENNSTLYVYTIKEMFDFQRKMAQLSRDLESFVCTIKQLRHSEKNIKG